MRKQSLFTLVLVLLVSVFSIQLAACGDDSTDPAGESTNGSNTSDTSTSGGSGTSSTTGTSTTGTTTDTSTGGTTTDTSTGGTSTNNGTTGPGTTGPGTTGPGTSTGGTSTGECENDWFTGQVFADEDDPGSPNGGNAVFEPFTNDAGLGAILAASPAIPQGETSASADIDLNVVEATVVATSYNTANTQRANRIFWLGDANGYIKIFFPACVEAPVEPTDIACDDPRYPVFPVKVGQKVSFKATRVTDFSGVVEVTNASDWLLNSENNDVYIKEKTGETITPSEINTVVRVTGTLSGESVPCGGSSNCWDLDYGADSTIVFRSASTFLNGGDCITFVGAVGAFNGEAQLNAESFDWVWNNSSSN